MLLPRRILPSDTLENGFRVAHNETVDAMPDYSQCQVTDAGLLQFYNDLGQFIGEIDLSAVFRKVADASGSGAAPQFYSASETTEGVAKIATADDVEAGDDQFKFITPALLKYAFDLLKQEIIDSGTKTLDELAEETPRLGQDTHEADRAAIVNADGHLGGMAWSRLAEYIAANIPDYTAEQLLGKQLPFLSLSQLIRQTPQVSETLYLTGQARYLGLRPAGSPYPFGLQQGVIDANGAYNFGDYLLWNTLHQLFIGLNGKQVGVLAEDRIDWQVSETVFGGRITTDNVRVANPELADGIDYLFVGNRRGPDGRMLDSGNTMHQQIVSMTTLVRAIINHPVFVASFGQPTTAEPISRTILCYDKYDTQSGPLTLSPSKIGTPQPHTLHLPATQIFGRVSYPDGQLAPGYALSYPDLDHYQLDYAGASGETSDLIIELYKRVS